MVNLFGDWTGDMLVILLALIVYFVMRVFILTEKKAVEKLFLVVAIVIFVISGWEVLGNIFGELYIGPQGSLYISLILFIGSIIFIINQIVELKSEKK